MTDEPLRWGILGTGNMAAQFAADLALTSSGRIVAVGSRAATNAAVFCERHGVGGARASYEALVADPDVEAVYVASPNPLHHPLALAALVGDKAVLVEKPFTVNAVQGAELVQVARERGRFLMEAMWTRCLPHVRALREVLAAGRIGDVRLLVAEHGIGFPMDTRHRIYDPGLAGGALLDLGVYLLSLASLAFGRRATSM